MMPLCWYDASLESERRPKKKFKFIGNGAATGHTHNTNTHILYTSVAQNQISVSWREGK